MAATDSTIIRDRAAGAGGVLALFTATLFLSAFLLFSVQPFFAKMVLPRLGGSPGVWSVAMVFFQSMLLLGYAYAHALTGRLALRTAALVHAGLLVAAFVALPIAIPAGWDAPPETGQAVWLLGLFAVSVGLPFLAVSATAPLLQAWFARTGHPHAGDPYFLYGASNIGSFASLILFIVFFEPFFTVGQQSMLWSGGFVLLACLIGACAATAIRGGQDVPVAGGDASGAAFAAVPARPIMWCVLAFVPSGLLVAVTAHVSTDVAAAPFLWVVPLALFLLTFVFAFRRKPLVSVSTLSRALPLMGALAVIAVFAPHGMPVWANLAVHLAFFFAAALFCHARLFELRPEASRLTGFYLWMSFGGVLGGAFASLASPVLFDWVAEYPLLIVAALLLRPEVAGIARQRLVGIGAIAAAVAGALYIASSVPGIAALYDAGTVGAVLIAVAVAAAALQYVSQQAFVLMMLLIVPLGFVFSTAGGALFHERSFFGVVKVVNSADGRYRLMVHGTTLHGAMALDGAARPEPIAYYHESGGIASALHAMQSRRGGAIGHGGLVGLGAGSLMCHTRPGERWTAFEIDRAVVDAATDPALFRFMPECGPDVPMVIGDARLTLERQPDASFDFLLVDAFSSDSIPVHLMTREAVRLYMDKVKADGIVAMHISNRYLELQSVLAAIAAEEGLAIRGGLFARGGPDDNPYISTSRVVVLARKPADFGPINDDPRWSEPAAGSTQAWTDDFSNVFTALLRKP